MIAAWFRRLLGLERPSSPRLVTLQNLVDDLDARVDYLGAELKKLRGRVTGAERKEKPLEDPPGRTNGVEALDRPRAVSYDRPTRNLRGF